MSSAPKPILFSGPMVRAILAGTKTQTRRIIKPQPRLLDDEKTLVFNLKNWLCPYGVPGDRLWMRETWSTILEDSRTDCERVVYRADGEIERQVWRPSIHMPRWASRITLEITEVRVQRVQEISEEDARAEGMIYHGGGGVGHSGWRHDINYGCVYNTAREALATGWDCIYSRSGLDWDANPWVWAITFRRVD